MKAHGLCGCLLVVSTLSNSVAVAQEAPAAVPEGSRFPQTWLEGTIGQSATVRLFVEPAGYPKMSGLWGMYYYTRYWTPIPLEGEHLSPDTIRLYEGEPNGNSPSRPRFDLNVSEPATVTGTWTSGDGRRTLPVRLRRIAQPAAYETAIQNSRRFADTRWPIEFNYPAGWFLEVTGKKLVMRSPDPKDMLFRNFLECARGRGLPSVPVVEEAVVHFQGSYYRASEGWRVDTGPGPGPDCEGREGRNCETPKTRQAGSAILMSAHIYYRSYGPWGYAGIAGAREHLVIDGSDWVHCFDRLLDSDDRIRPRNTMGRGRR
jgi:hypothetical protein